MTMANVFILYVNATATIDTGGHFVQKDDRYSLTVDTAVLLTCCFPQYIFLFTLAHCELPQRTEQQLAHTHNTLRTHTHAYSGGNQIYSKHPHTQMKPGD